MFNTIQSTIVSQVGAAFIDSNAFRRVVAAAHYESDNIVTFECPLLRRSVRIEYNEGYDEYNVTVTQYARNTNEKTVKTDKGVYCDQLGDYFVN